MAVAANDVVKMINGDCHDFKSILSSPDRDFLVRNNADQVKIDSLKGKTLGLFFSASWCRPCLEFTPHLVEAYSRIAPEVGFEVILVSTDDDEELFNDYFSKLPWLAIPFSDSISHKRVDESFRTTGIPRLVVLDENGKVLTNDGVGMVREYGEEGYPFTSKRIQEIKDLDEKARKEQSLKTLLVSRYRDFVVTSDGNKVPVSELEGKTVGLYFSMASFHPSADYTQKLAEVYKKLKEKGENFEVVAISLEDGEEPFKKSFGAPWFALPFKDKTCKKLARYFELSAVPTIVIIGPDGKTLHPNAADAIDDHGVEAYPFTPEKFAELEEIVKAKEAAQTLESILISGDLDYVIGKDGAKVKVTDLVGKIVLLYFSAHWCPPCRAFTPKLIEVYKKLKAKGEAFEVIFITSDIQQTSFEEYYSGMPWLVLPFDDARTPSLKRKFKVKGIPMLIAIGPTGKTVTKEASGLIMAHGVDAYPFTEERLEEIEARYEEMAKGWPKNLKHELHEEHELELTRCDSYMCDRCNYPGQIWTFYCRECDFDLHPKCALEKDKETKGGAEKEGNTKEGWVCDEEVCTRAR
ncbi:hypothetical protein V6N13_108022 [Hibiscus sabdariffa]|uniref:protein-disulfide reductase n=1 Tax=Hibiscus sabdariffa TaxID=183260 RepID=A0ABR2SRU8_9ROSI